MEIIVISVGGSLIRPGKDINTEFLNKFKLALVPYIEKGMKFVIITGGGYLAREFQKELRAKGISNSDELDLAGIKATQINANFVKKIFGKHAHPEILTEDYRKNSFAESIIVGGGTVPGQSSDAATVQFAENFKAKKIINMSNIDQVYDSDPKTNSNANPIEKITWENYIKLIPTEWSPGMNTPFDPVAARKAQDLKMEVAIMNGNFSNLKKYLDNEKFKGTVIKN